MDERLKTAQEQIAHLTRITDDLSDELARQGREVDLLTRRLALLLQREAEREADQGGTAPLADPPPPHW